VLLGFIYSVRVSDQLVLHMCVPHQLLQTISTTPVYNIVEMSPRHDPSDLSIDQMLDAFESGYNNSAPDQCSILADSSQCVTSFGLDTVASTWYNPGQLPSGFPGTAPLSDTTAGGSFTRVPRPRTLIRSSQFIYSSLHRLCIMQKCRWDENYCRHIVRYWDLYQSHLWYYNRLYNRCCELFHRAEGRCSQS